MLRSRVDRRHARLLRELRPIGSTSLETQAISGISKARVRVLTAADGPRMVHADPCAPTGVVATQAARGTASTEFYFMLRTRFKNPSTCETGTAIQRFGVCTGSDPLPKPSLPRASDASPDGPSFGLPKHRACRRVNITHAKCPSYYLP